MRNIQYFIITLGIVLCVAPNKVICSSNPIKRISAYERLPKIEPTVVFGTRLHPSTRTPESLLRKRNINNNVPHREWNEDNGPEAISQHGSSVRVKKIVRLASKGVDELRLQPKPINQVFSQNDGSEHNIGPRVDKLTARSASTISLAETILSSPERTIRIKAKPTMQSSFRNNVPGNPRFRPTVMRPNGPPVKPGMPEIKPTVRSSFPGAIRPPSFVPPQVSSPHIRPPSVASQSFGPPGIAPPAFAPPGISPPGFSPPVHQASIVSTPGIQQQSGFAVHGPPSGSMNGPPGIPLPHPPSPPHVPMTSPPAIPLPFPPATHNPNGKPPGPTPPPGRGRGVTDIRCIQQGDRESFSATISLPSDFEAVPVIEDRPLVDPTTHPTCRMGPTALVGMFRLSISEYDACGVTKCRIGIGEKWLCLVLRFPLLTGLKLPEDEIVEIRCRPQEPTAQKIDSISVATANLTGRSPAIFESGRQEFVCEIALLRQIAGTKNFNQLVRNDIALELGEEVQLVARVRSSDGWFYSRLGEVIIQKKRQDNARSLSNIALLVFSNGCRNPAYTLIAPQNPTRSADNPLENKFNFRVFMFQDMERGDTLMISAKVIGCVEEIDCQPLTCAGIDNKRKRRAVNLYERTITTTLSSVLDDEDMSDAVPFPGGPPYQNSPSMNSHISRSSASIRSPFSNNNYYNSSPIHRDHRYKQTHSNTTKWKRNLDIKVRLPDGAKPLNSATYQECQIYLFITLGVALVFCAASVIFVVHTFIKSHRKLKLTSQEIMQNASNVQMVTQADVSKLSSFEGPLSSLNNETSFNETSTAFAMDLAKLPRAPVPATVRQRKHAVNAELLDMFGEENGYPFTRYYPGMMNYYGYMVMPRKCPSENQIQTQSKKSVKAIKRDERKRSDRHFNHFANDNNEDDDRCSCDMSMSDRTHYSDRGMMNRAYRDIKTYSNNHKSVIHINGCQAPSQNPNLQPRPLPRINSTNKNDNIYCEIKQETKPTMV